MDPAFVAGSGVCGQPEYYKVFLVKYHERTQPMTSSSLQVGHVTIDRQLLQQCVLQIHILV